MILMKLLDVYSKINNCPRKMGALQVMCALGDVHREGTEWMLIKDMESKFDIDKSNLYPIVKQLEAVGLIEKRYSQGGRIVDQVTRSSVIRLVPECIEALGGGNEAYV